MEVNIQIKKYRSEMQLSQEELAEKVYVSRQTISNWETGKNYPDIHSLLLLSTVFNTSLDQLIKGDVEIMKKEIKELEIKKLNRYGIVFSILLIATIVSAVPLAVWLGFYAFIPWGVLFAVTMIFAFRTEKIKKDNHIRTYKEIVAFVGGKRLDELETQQETGKLPYQRLLMVLGIGLIALIVCLVLSICLWTNPADKKEPAQTVEALVELARSEIPLSNVQDANLQAVGRIDKGDKTLLIIQAGDEAPYSYFPVTYEYQNTVYKVSHVAKDGMSERATHSCYSYQWGDGYAILLNNEKCAKLRITDELGKEEWVELTSLPFFFYDKDAFVDLNGDGKAGTSYALFGEDEQELGF